MDWALAENERMQAAKIVNSLFMFYDLVNLTFAHLTQRVSSRLQIRRKKIALQLFCSGNIPQ